MRSRCSRLPMTTVSRLLKSCAIPPVKCPDRLDLLGLPKPLFERLLFRDVAGHFGETQQISGGVANGVDDDARQKGAAVLANAPALRFVFSGLRGGGEGGFRNTALAIFRGVETREMLADYFRLGVPLDPLRSGIPTDDMAGPIEHENRVIGHPGDQKLKRSFALLSSEPSRQAGGRDRRRAPPSSR